MKKIDTHGLKMTNLRKACSDTKGLRGCGSVSSPATMQELSDLIFETVCARRAYEEVGA